MVHNLYRAVIPYNGQFIHLEDSRGQQISYWDNDKITENWLFSRGDKVTRGLCWNKDYKMKIDKWMVTFHHNLGSLKAGESVKLKPITVAMGVFDNWQDFRAFAINNRDQDTPSSLDSFQTLVNGGNPFVKDSLRVEIRETKNTCFEGEIVIKSQGGLFAKQRRNFDEKDNIRQSQFDVSIEKSNPMDVINIGVDFETIGFERKKAIFNLSKEEVKTGTLVQDSMEVYYADNGVISIMAAPSYSNSLFSLKYRNREWLDNSFPVPGPKSWWNPWTGGIQTLPGNLGNSTLLNEKRGGEIVTLQDDKGNQWKGIKISTKIENDSEYRGLELNQYFLMQPGVPLVCHTLEIVQNMGCYLRDMDFTTEGFLSPDSNLKESWIIYDNIGEKIKLKAGKADHLIQSYSAAMYGSNNRQEKLIVACDLSKSMLQLGTNNKTIAWYLSNRLSLAQGQSLFLPPVFLLLRDEFTEYGLMEDLIKIRF